jgi:hypothetical protein
MTRARLGTLALLAALLPLAAPNGCILPVDPGDGEDHVFDDGLPEDSDTGDACDAAWLTGAWYGDGCIIAFATDLSYEVADSPSFDSIDAYGQAAVDGCAISFADEGGPLACPADQVGVYEFSVDATTLELTAVMDPCDGWRAPLDGAVFSNDIYSANPLE